MKPHYNSLKKQCKELGLDSTNIKTTDGLQELIKNNKDHVILARAADNIDEIRNDMIATPITLPSAEDVKMYAPHISETKLRIENIRQRLKELFGTKYSFTIDENEMTVHFLGANKGLECTTLQQPDKAIIGTAIKYIGYTALAKGDIGLDRLGRRNDQ